MWGLPQAGILANKHLQRKLAPFGYSECVNTPRLWWHETRPISFTLIIDDFGVKYVSKNDVNHLIKSIKSKYMLTEDRTGNLYCGITLEWNYVNRHVDISMPNYLKQSRRIRAHYSDPYAQLPIPPQTPPKWVGSAGSPPPNATPPLDAAGIKRFQKIVSSILYYARAINMTVLMGLSSITVEQTKATEKTTGRCIDLLNYFATIQDAKVRFHASNRVMNIHSDVLYLSETKSRSRACGHLFGMDA